MSGRGWALGSGLPDAESGSGLRYVMNEKMTNQSLRERFRLSEKKTESASRAIRDAVEADKIKLADPEQTSLRYRNYVPFWA